MTCTKTRYTLFPFALSCQLLLTVLNYETKHNYEGTVTTSSAPFSSWSSLYQSLFCTELFIEAGQKIWTKLFLQHPPDTTQFVLSRYTLSHQTQNAHANNQKKQMIYLFLKQVPVWTPSDNVPRNFLICPCFDCWFDQMHSRGPFNFIRSSPTRFAMILWHDLPSTQAACRWLCCLYSFNNKTLKQAWGNSYVPRRQTNPQLEQSSAKFSTSLLSTG